MANRANLPQYKHVAVIIPIDNTQYYIVSKMCFGLPNNSIFIQKLHDKYADEVLHIILLLRGFYIKVGQTRLFRRFIASSYLCHIFAGRSHNVTDIDSVCRDFIHSNDWSIVATRADILPQQYLVRLQKLLV